VGCNPPWLLGTFPLHTLTPQKEDCLTTWGTGFRRYHQTLKVSFSVCFALFKELRIRE
jgi:hypothetical protein